MTSQETEAVARVFIKTGSHMVRRAYSSTGNHEEAEDLVQESFTRLSSRGALRDIASLEAFLWTILRNLLIERGRHPQQTELASSLSDDSEAPEAGSWIESIEDAIRALRPRQRRLLEHLAAGRAISQIASIEGSTSHVISSAVGRARNNLKRELMRRGMFV